MEQAQKHPQDLPTHQVKSTTYVIGKRPTDQRALSRFLRNGWKITKGVGIGLLAAIAVVTTTVGDNLADDLVMQDAVIPATIENISWVELEQTPFMEAGKSSDGKFDLWLMMQRWKDAGIPIGDFGEVIRLGRASAPMIMGTNDPVMVARQQQQARKANAELRERWPGPHALLSNAQWLAANDTTYKLDKKTEKIFQEYQDILLTEMGLDEINGYEDFVEFNTAEEAREFVELAMKETGLRSLRMTAPAARDYTQMGNAAYKLIQLNDILRNRTGWEGGVLGLGGRVDWVLSKAGNGADGATYTTPHEHKDPNKLVIVSPIGSAAHEAWHGMETLFLRMSARHQLSGTVMMNVEATAGKFIFDDGEVVIDLKDLRVRRNHDLIHNILALNKAIFEESPEWIGMRAQAQEKMGLTNNYYLRGQEVLAAAFSGQVLQWDKSSVNEPGFEDADRHAPYFEAVFRSADHLKLTKRPTTRLSTLNWNMGNPFTKTEVLNAENITLPDTSAYSKDKPNR